jgi:hypothetical protein
MGIVRVRPNEDVLLLLTWVPSCQLLDIEIATVGFAAAWLANIDASAAFT